MYNLCLHLCQPGGGGEDDRYEIKDFFTKASLKHGNPVMGTYD